MEIRCSIKMRNDQPVKSKPSPETANCLQGRCVEPGMTADERPWLDDDVLPTFPPARVASKTFLGRKISDN